MQTAMRKTTVPQGYGINDEAGIYFQDEKVEQTEGQVFYFTKEAL
ncbi:hypothetical protein [Sediminibacillus massiliensis]|nr:hypothetical protein [Sediminibacillus massiliensis]